jgi:hypothetical protein
MKIENFKFVYDDDGLSHITCYLGNNNFFDIEHFDFVCFLCDNYKNLKSYTDKFETLEDVIHDLDSLGFDFKEACEKYILTQFTEEQIQEFTYSEF